jgi:hypothetical protein
MKSICSTFLIFALLTLSLTTSRAHADGGVSHGGGGNLAAHFSEIGQRLGDAFQMICGAPKYRSSRLCELESKFFDATRNPHVVGFDVVVGPADGKSRDAGPDGVGGIQLSNPAWEKLIKDKSAVERAVGLCAHEFMILAGGDKNDEYMESPQLMSALRGAMMDFSAILGKIPGPAISRDLRGYIGNYSTYREGDCDIDLQVSGDDIIFNFNENNRSTGCKQLPSLVFQCEENGLNCLPKNGAYWMIKGKHYGPVTLLEPGKSGSLLIEVDWALRKAVRN